MKTTKIILGLAVPVLAAWAVRTKIRSERVSNAPDMVTNFKLLYKVVIPRVANKILKGRYLDRADPNKGRFTQTDVNRVVDKIWLYYDEFAPKAHVEQLKTLGNIHNKLGALLVHAIYQALLSEGIEKEYATELASDVLWVVYERMMVLPRSIARLATRDPQKQVSIMWRLFFRFPFSAPGYKWTVSEEKDVFKMDTPSCPKYDYLKSQGEEEFMQKTFCKTDYALARMMTEGGSYERPHNLAAGDDVCDMRWYGKPKKATIGKQET